MRIIQSNPLSDASFLVTIDDLPEVYFEVIDGGVVTFNRPMHTDGLSARKRRAQVGTQEVSDITFSKSFDPELASDIALVQWINDHKDGKYFNLSALPVNRSNDVEQRGQILFQLQNCRLLSHSTTKSIDLSSGTNIFSIEMTASVEEALMSQG